MIVVEFNYIQKVLNSTMVNIYQITKQMHTHRWGVKMIISIGLPIFYSKLYILKLDYFPISFLKKYVQN